MYRHKVYRYEWNVTCNTCGGAHSITAISINPNKTHITEGRNLQTGVIEDKGQNTYRLPCGHTQNVFGTLVYPIREEN